MGRVLALPCREHTVLYSRQLDAPLTRGEIAGLRFHAVYCRSCRRFRDHLGQMRDLARALAGESPEGQGIPAEVRERLIHRVTQASKKNG